MNYELIGIKKDSSNKDGGYFISHIEERKGLNQEQAMAWATMVDLFKDKKIHIGFVQDRSQGGTMTLYCARTIEEVDEDTKNPIISYAVIPTDMEIEYIDQIEALLEL
jgi:hypothetical protein